MLGARGQGWRMGLLCGDQLLELQHGQFNQRTIIFVFEIRLFLLLALRDEGMVLLRQSISDALCKTKANFFIQGPNDESLLGVELWK